MNNTMTEAQLSELIRIGAPIALVVIFIGIAYLWNTKYRPRQQQRGIAVDKFGGSLSRLFRFIFREDKTTIFPKSKNEKVKKIFTFNFLYMFLLSVAGIMHFLFPLWAWIPFLIFIAIVLSRAPKVLKERQKTLIRMLTVANTIFRYGRGAELDPWSYIRVKKWLGYTTPGETIVSFPASWVSSPASRDGFEEHFNQTVTADNTWVYQWDTSKGMVTCAPVGHIPTKAMYEGSADRPWNEIPLGLGAAGEIVWDVTKEPHALVCGKTGGGKSVAQRNIIFHTIQHNDKWCFLGVDPKRVELKPYKKYTNTVLGIATTLEDEVEVIRYAKEEMMRRFQAMEDLGVNHFKDLPNPPRAIMLMVDEAYQLMAPEGIKTDEGKENDNLHGEASMLIGEIARLGRAAGVHLTLAMQRPDAVVLKGELKNNLDVRVAAGRLDSTPSAMVLDSGAATRVPGDIKGRGVVRIGGDVEQYQGYFAEQNWIDSWLLKPENRHREPEVVEALLAEQGDPHAIDMGHVEDFTELDEDTEIDESRLDASDDFMSPEEQSAGETYEPSLEEIKEAQEKKQETNTPTPVIEAVVSMVEEEKIIPLVEPEPVKEIPTQPSFVEKKQEAIPSLEDLLPNKTSNQPSNVEEAPKTLPQKPTLPPAPAGLPPKPSFKNDDFSL